MNEDSKCEVCGKKLDPLTTLHTCGDPVCGKKYGELRRARWQGHLERNNVDTDKR